MSKLGTERADDFRDLGRGVSGKVRKLVSWYSDNNLQAIVRELEKVDFYRYTKAKFSRPQDLSPDELNKGKAIDYVRLNNLQGPIYTRRREELYKILHGDKGHINDSLVDSLSEGQLIDITPSPGLSYAVSQMNNIHLGVDRLDFMIVPRVLDALSAPQSMGKGIMSMVIPEDYITFLQRVAIVETSRLLFITLLLNPDAPINQLVQQKPQQS